MKILITGLTLHNNKGGPALAYSMMKQLRKYLNNVEFYMMVPRFNDNVSSERKWKDFYGVTEVYPTPSVKIMLFPFCLQRNIRNNKHDFLKMLKNMDIIIDLTALSYMDLPHKSFMLNLYTNIGNYLTRYYADQCRIPMCRWTQSYGPFKYFITKFIVKKDLSKQGVIFSRGEESTKFLKQVMPKADIRNFPDVAIKLPVKYEFINHFIIEKQLERYITISPSSVMFSIEKNKHIEYVQKIVEYALNKNYTVIFVPHTMVKAFPVASKCDLVLSRLIVKKYNDNPKIFVVEDDLDPMNLKGIISKAELHIGARYHSVVAALSTATPVISLSWHNKYLDIMKMYGVDQYVAGDVDSIVDLVQKACKNHDLIVRTLQEKQILLEQEIEINTKIMVELINSRS